MRTLELCWPVDWKMDKDRKTKARIAITITMQTHANKSKILNRFNMRTVQSLDHHIDVPFTSFPSCEARQHGMPHYFHRLLDGHSMILSWPLHSILPHSSVPQTHLLPLDPLCPCLPVYGDG